MYTVGLLYLYFNDTNIFQFPTEKSEWFPGFTKELWEATPEKEKIMYSKRFATLFHEYELERRFKNASKMTIYLKVVQKMFTEKAHSKTIDLMRLDILKKVNL